MPPDGCGPDATNAGARSTTQTATVQSVQSAVDCIAVRFSEADAVAITAAIRSSLIAVWDKVAAAYHGRAWVPLGYDSWDDYCESEFGGSRIRIPREQRQDVVTSLRDEGLSLRAIAAATGQSYGTVQAEAASDQNRSLELGRSVAEMNVPTPAITTGLNGKTYQRPTPAPRGDVIDAEVVEETEEAQRLAKAKAAEAKAAADEKLAMTDLYSQIACGLQAVGNYGGHSDINNLMAKYSVEYLDPPQYERAYSAENLRNARRFIDNLLEWQAARAPLDGGAR